MIKNSFSQCFRPLIRTGFVKAKEVITTSSTFSESLGAISRFKSYLSTDTGSTDSFCGALLLDSSLISDRYLNSKAVEVDVDHPDWVTVDDSVAEQLVGGIGEAIHNGTDDSDFASITISDASGRIYNVVDQRDEDVVIGDNTVLFSMTYDVSSINEAIVYRDGDGHYHLNNTIRTADFVHSSATRVKPDVEAGNELDVLKDIVYISTGEYPQSNDITTVLKIVHNFNEEYVAWERAVIDYASSLGIETSGMTVLDALSAIWDVVDSENPLPSGSGSAQSIWTLVNDNLESSAINDALSKGCSVILGTSNPATAFDALNEELSVSRFSSVRRIGASLKRAYGESGLASAAGYILNYAKSMTQLRNDSPVLEPTDNTRFIPKGYIAGMVKALISAVVTMVGYLVSMFTRILGVVISLIGQAFKAIFKAVDSNSRASIEIDNTKSVDSINSQDPGGHVCFPIAPYSLCARNTSLSGLTNVSPDLLSLINQDQLFFNIEIPGGYLLLGPAAYNDEGQVTSMRFEFHPSIVHIPDSVVSQINGQIYDMDIARFSSSGARPGMGTDVSQIQCTLDWSTYPFSKGSLRQFIQEVWSNNLQNSTYGNSSDGYVTATTDEAIRRNIMLNTYIGALFLSTLVPDGQVDYFNDPAFGKCKGRATSDHEYSWLLSPIGSSGYVGFWYPLAFFMPTINGTTDRIRRTITFAGGTSGQILIGSSGVSALSWEDFYDEFIQNGESQRVTDSSKTSMYRSLLEDRQYYGEINLLPLNFKYAIRIPSVSKKAFWSELILTLIVTGLISGAIALSTFKIKKVILKKRAFNERQVATAWDAFTENPTEENYQLYRRAAKKNNLWANFIGGTKFGYDSYWNGSSGDDSAGAGSPSTVVGNVFQGAGGDIAADGSTDSSAAVASSTDDERASVRDTERLIKILTGFYSTAPQS